MELNFFKIKIKLITNYKFLNFIFQFNVKSGKSGIFRKNEIKTIY